MAPILTLTNIKLLLFAKVGRAICAMFLCVKEIAIPSKATVSDRTSAVVRSVTMEKTVRDALHFLAAKTEYAKNHLNASVTRVGQEYSVKSVRNKLLWKRLAFLSVLVKQVNYIL